MSTAALGSSSSAAARCTPYQSKPSTQWIESFQRLSETRLFLLARDGPTVFKIREESSASAAEDSSDSPAPAITCKVTLANPIQCTCASVSVPCVHILYCLVKVLRVDRHHPYCYQTSLTDSEIDGILSGSCRERTQQTNRPRRTFLRKHHQQQQREQQDDATDGDNGDAEEEDIESGSHSVKRRQLLRFEDDTATSATNDEDDITCPICCDDMDPMSDESLTWCRTGCGRNFHAKCMTIYAQHQQRDISCPLCRTAINMAMLRKDMLTGGKRYLFGVDGKPLSAKPQKHLKNGTATSAASAAHASGKYAISEAIHCHFCKCLQRRLFHRCLECSQKSTSTTAVIANSSSSSGGSSGTSASSSAPNKTIDFCTDCFDRKRLSEMHKTHHFVSSDASIVNVYEVSWTVTRNPFAFNSTSTEGVLSEAERRQLQQRDITPDDYDLLRRLDNPSPTQQQQQQQQPQHLSLHISFAEHLVQCLPILSPTALQANPIKYGTTCYCLSARDNSLSDELPDSPMSSQVYCQLLCGHVAHRSCVAQDVDTIVREDDISHVAFYRCSHVGCGRIVFPSLRRRTPRPPKAVAATANESTSSMTLKLGHAFRTLASGQSLGQLGISGVSIDTGGAQPNATAVPLESTHIAIAAQQKPSRPGQRPPRRRTTTDDPSTTSPLAVTAHRSNGSLQASAPAPPESSTIATPLTMYRLTSHRASSPIPSDSSTASALASASILQTSSNPLPSDALGLQIQSTSSHSFADSHGLHSHSAPTSARKPTLGTRPPKHSSSRLRSLTASEVVRGRDDCHDPSHPSSDSLLLLQSVQSLALHNDTSITLNAVQSQRNTAPVVRSKSAFGAAITPNRSRVASSGSATDTGAEDMTSLVVPSPQGLLPSQHPSHRSVSRNVAQHLLLRSEAHQQQSSQRRQRPSPPLTLSTETLGDMVRVNHYQS